MTRIETAQQALELLEKAVATRGEDYVYRRHEGFCTYTHDGEPDCLIGVVLHSVGWTIEELRQCDNMGSVPSVAEDPTFADRLGNEAIGVLDAAQAAQDDSLSWGVALQKARDRASEYPN